MKKRLFLPLIASSLAVMMGCAGGAPKASQADAAPVVLSQAQVLERIASAMNAQCPRPAGREGLTLSGVAYADTSFVFTLTFDEDVHSFDFVSSHSDQLGSLLSEGLFGNGSEEASAMAALLARENGRFVFRLVGSQSGKSVEVPVALPEDHEHDYGNER